MCTGKRFELLLKGSLQEARGDRFSGDCELILFWLWPNEKQNGHSEMALLWQSSALKLSVIIKLLVCDLKKTISLTSKAHELIVSLTWILYMATAREESWFWFVDAPMMLHLFIQLGEILSILCHKNSKVFGKWYFHTEKHKLQPNNPISWKLHFHTWSLFSGFCRKHNCCLDYVYLQVFFFLNNS